MTFVVSSSCRKALAENTRNPFRMGGGARKENLTQVFARSKGSIFFLTKRRRRFEKIRKTLDKK